MSWFQAPWLGSEGARAERDAGGLGKTWQSSRLAGGAALAEAVGLPAPLDTPVPMRVAIPPTKRTIPSAAKSRPAESA